MLCKYLILILLFLVSGVGFSQTSVPGGDVSGMWEIVGSPFLINGDITIPNDSTLTINPGVVVEFQGNYGLDVQGRLLAVGTETDTILFTINDTTGFGNPNIPNGGWNGIRFIETLSLNDSSMIVYCRLQFGKTTGTWPYENGGAICLINFDKLRLANCLLINNRVCSQVSGSPGGGAICLEASSPVLLNNVISNNSANYGGGILIEMESNPLLMDNVIVDNHASEGGGGICCWESEPTLNKNIIRGNISEVGGGMIAGDATLHINNCIFDENAAKIGEGGGIIVMDCNLFIDSCLIDKNYAITDGGGLASFGSYVVLENVNITGNNAEVGAGIYCVRSDFALNNVIVDNNVSLREGGAFQIHDSNLQLESCIVSNNLASESGGGFQYLADESEGETYEIKIAGTKFINNITQQSGGGLAVVNPEQVLTTVKVFIDQCQFTSNSADLNAGLHIFGDSVNCTLTNSIFIGNEAVSSGAAVGFDMKSIGFVSNCLFAFNGPATSSSLWFSGGAGVINESEVNFVNCTFVGNSAMYGAGLTVAYGAVTSTTNCIFWGNSTDQIAIADGNLNVSYCDIEGGQDGIIVSYGNSPLNWGAGNIDKYPMFVDWENENFHLTDYSPCIGSGSLTGAPVNDLDGNLRPDPPGSDPDLGVYENELGSPLQEPNIVVSDDSLDFDQVFLGVTDSLTLVVSNTGTLDLLITSIGADLSEYSVSPTFAGIDPLESEVITITFLPQSTGIYQGKLTFISNDPDSDSLVVTLNGQGVEPPDISVHPDSFSQDLFTGQVSTQTLTIENRGVTDLDFNISVETSNYALQFDGINDLVLIGDSNFPHSSDERTITLWFNTNAEYTSAMGTLFNYGIGYENFQETYLSIQNWGSGNVFQAGTGGPNSNIYGSSTVNDGMWHFAAAVYDGTLWKTYVDGTEETIYQGGISPNTNTMLSGNAMIGSSVFYDQFFNGTIDEICLWNNAHTQAEIKSDMYRVLYGNESGLIGYWPFNEGIGTTTYDQTSSNNDGYLFNDISWSKSSAPVNKWLIVDIDSGTISTGSSVDITISFNAAGLLGGDYNKNIFIYSNDPDESLILIPAHLYVTGVPHIALSDSILDFKEVYIGFPKTDSLVVSNIGTDLLTIYNITSDNSVFSVDTTSLNLNVRENLQFAIKFAPDTIGIYTGVLTVTSNDPDYPTRTISLLGQGFKAPDIYVSQDSIGIACVAGDTIEQSFMIFNRGGSALNFDILIDYSFTTGAENYALQFDGIDDIVRVYEQDIFDLTTDLTIEAWIKAFTTDGPRVIVAKWNDYGPDFSYIFKIWNSSDKLSIELSEYNNFGDLAFLEGNTSIPINEWIHVAITYNSNEVKVYYNGIEDNSINASGSIRNSITDIIIGANSYGDYLIENFYGLIDEVRIWDLARNQSEIQADMYREIAADETGLIGYWRFNEGSGGTAFDQSKYGNNGILQNGTNWIESTAPVSPRWFSVDPHSGTIIAGDSLEIKAKFDSRDLTEGNNKAYVNITSNDPLKSEITIPVQLLVSPYNLAELRNNNIPNTYSLQQNYPNPFNPITNIRYGLPKVSDVKIEVYNVLGQNVAILVLTRKPAGYHLVEWDASQFSSGVYFYRIEAREFRDVKKMILLK